MSDEEIEKNEEVADEDDDFDPLGDDFDLSLINDDDLTGGDDMVVKDTEDLGEMALHEDSTGDVYAQDLAINVNERAAILPKRGEVTKKKFNFLMLLPVGSGLFSLLGILVPLIIYLVSKGSSLPYAPPIWIMAQSSPEYEISICLLSLFSIFFSVVCVIKYKALDSIGISKIVNFLVLIIGFCVPFGLIFLIVWKEEDFPVCHEIGGWVVLLSQ